MIDSYESVARLAAQPDPVMETYRGQDIVTWYGNIERQLLKLVDKYRNTRQDEAAAKAEQFLLTWRRNVITGSINRGTIETLEAAAGGLAVDNWKSQSYFGALRDQLRKLMASEEELPRLPDDSVAAEGPSAGRVSPAGQFDAQAEEPTATNPTGEEKPEKEEEPVIGATAAPKPPQ